MAVLQHEGTLEILYRDFAMPSGAGFTNGYMARPDRIGDYPLVVLLPPLDGIVPFVKDMARRLARHGYAVLVPDLTRCRHPGPEASFDDLAAAYNEISDRRARADIEDAVSFALADPAGWARPGRIGMVGIDVGGRFALVYAAYRQQTVGALCVIYAPLTGDGHRQLPAAEALEMLPMPVLGLYGADDELVSVAEVDQAQGLNPHGRWIVYEGVGHHYLDDDSDSYHHAAVGDTMSRLLKLLNATIG
ncbi:MAG: dienelactone hydrolase family protein [Acidimicrobiia bacterium]|nr:dienelactone hydrolase family protein [Acidimicrobiia bacterium]MYF26116.1 dienelactone hydrolase family protein [Acidimicrobiia bacterium]